MKGEGETDEPKEAFGIEPLPFIEMGSWIDSVVAVELVLGYGKRGVTEYAG
jgi:hypothetical protein